MSHDLVQVASFRDYIGASIARTKLESEGIRCFVFNDIIVTLDWFYSDLYGGVKLMVAEAEQEMARAVLATKPTTLEELDEESFAMGETRCPACSCMNAYEDRLPRRLFFLTILLGGASGQLLPFVILPYFLIRPILRPKHVCANCGHRWTRERDSSR